MKPMLLIILGGEENVKCERAGLIKAEKKLTLISPPNWDACMHAQYYDAVFPQRSSNANQWPWHQILIGERIGNYI